MRDFKILISILFVWFAAHTIYIVFDGMQDDGKSADVAVVLGNEVLNDGTLSMRLEQRVNCSLKLYQAMRVKKIIVSGAIGKSGFYEGDKMRDYLIKNGVPDSCVIVDNFGKNTLATAINTLKLKDSLHFENIIVVSQYYHITRIKMLFRKRGFYNLSSASANYFEFNDLFATFREFVAYYKERWWI